MWRCIRCGFFAVGLLLFQADYNLLAQKHPQATLTLPVQAGTTELGALMDPGNAAWQSIQARRIALNRTPRIFETEPPSDLEIPEIEVRLVRAGSKLVVRLNWRDASEDSAKIGPPPDVSTDGRFLKEHSDATNRFFDAAAVMCPAAGKRVPGLQMGDAQDPVTIYYWNAARGSMLMDARGRETTRHTGQTFPVRASYLGGSWNVSFELPELSQGTPLAFAVWNGSQQDRDGRKYFSVWHWLE
jgi:DMSO reductase family type II enzyme heme b subunit